MKKIMSSFLLVSIMALGMVGSASAQPNLVDIAGQKFDLNQAQSRDGMIKLGMCMVEDKLVFAMPNGDNISNTITYAVTCEGMPGELIVTHRYLDGDFNPFDTVTQVIIDKGHYYLELDVENPSAVASKYNLDFNIGFASFEDITYSVIGDDGVETGKQAINGLSRSANNINGVFNVAGDGHYKVYLKVSTEGMQVPEESIQKPAKKQ